MEDRACGPWQDEAKDTSRVRVPAIDGAPTASGNAAATLAPPSRQRAPTSCYTADGLKLRCCDYLEETSVFSRSEYKSPRFPPACQPGSVKRVRLRFVAHHVAGKTGTAREAMMRASAVTRVKPYTRAVAAMNRSAGSW